MEFRSKRSSACRRASTLDFVRSSPNVVQRRARVLPPDLPGISMRNIIEREEGRGRQSETRGETRRSALTRIISIFLKFARARARAAAHAVRISIGGTKRRIRYTDARRYVSVYIVIFFSFDKGKKSAGGMFKSASDRFVPPPPPPPRRGRAASL